MLFEKEELKSPYDFGESLPTEMCSYECLASHIKIQVDRIDEMLGIAKIKLLHTNNNNQDIYISSVKEEVRDRECKDIIKLLHREKHEKQTTIEKYIKQFGVIKPDPDSDDLPNYYKLLYFFYMLKYVIFQDENVFIVLDDNKHLSTDISPIENASNGDYAAFILKNIFDEKSVVEKIVLEDWGISLHDSNIAKIIDKIMNNKDKDLNERQNYLKTIETIIYDVRNEFYAESNKTEGVLNQAVDYLYRYQNVAYATEMLETLDPSKKSFNFAEFEVPFNEEWNNMIISIDDVSEFISAPELAKFYKQGKTHTPKGLDDFVRSVIAYDIDNISSCGQYYYLLESEEGELYISIGTLVLILKTYFDLGKTKFKIQIKYGKDKWRHELAYNNAFSGIIPDIAMRYFMIAFESECMNAVFGHGYYPAVFEPLYLAKYRLLQIVMVEALKIPDMSKREEFLLRIINEITIKITLNQG